MIPSFDYFHDETLYMNSFHLKEYFHDIIVGRSKKWL